MASDAAVEAAFQRPVARRLCATRRSASGKSPGALSGASGDGGLAEPQAGVVVAEDPVRAARPDEVERRLELDPAASTSRVADRA